MMEKVINSKCQNDDIVHCRKKRSYFFNTNLISSNVFEQNKMAKTSYIKNNGATSNYSNSPVK